MTHSVAPSNRNSSHTSRTMMLDELTLLLEYVVDPNARRQDYVDAVVNENCLRKRSGSNRRSTARHLIGLYGLDPEFAPFAALRYLWARSEDARPLLALLCACTRDPLLRASAALVCDLPEGTTITREETERWLSATVPERFSPATRRSTAQNLNGTWTQSGHLRGKVSKSRVKAQATPAAAAYAVFLAYLDGQRGMSLVHSGTTRLLDCAPQQVLELLREAAQRGWITLRLIGDVLEVRFPNFPSPQEME